MKYRSHINHFRSDTCNCTFRISIQKAYLYLIECVRSKLFGKVTTGRATYNYRRTNEKEKNEI